MRELTVAEAKKLAASGQRFLVDGQPLDLDKLEIPKPKKRSSLSIYFSELLQGAQNIITIHTRIAENMLREQPVIPPPLVTVNVPEQKMTEKKEVTWVFEIRDQFGMVTKTITAIPKN